MIESKDAHSRNRQVGAYLSEFRPLKFHETRLLEILRQDLGDFTGTLIDVGCASGLFLSHLRPAFPAAQLRGLELHDDLIAAAKKRLDGMDIPVEKGDAIAYEPAEKVDVVLASAVLSVFHNPLLVLDHWLSWLKPGGRLYVFGRFNSRDVDTRVEYRSHYKDEGWETGLTSFAVSTVRDHLAKKGYSATFERFVFPEDLPQSEDPIRHFTVSLANGERLMMNGANVIAEQYFAVISK